MPSRRKGLEQPLLSLTNSPLVTSTTQDSSWLTSPSYQQSSLSFNATAFHSVVDALLENPNLNSSHLFRADIIFDNTGILKTNQEKEEFCCIEHSSKEWDCKEERSTANEEDDDKALPPLNFVGFELRRTVLRRLIPRKPQLDRPLLQTCHIYTTNVEHLPKSDETICDGSHDQQCACQLSGEKLNNRLLYKQSIACVSQHLVVYRPHADPSTGSDMPWYHPPLKFLAFLYSRDSPSDSGQQKESGNTLSVHFQLFPAKVSTEESPSITDRVHRTLLSLLSTFVRLARNTPVHLDAINGEERAMPISATQHIKDNIIPEHLVQNTYSRLKAQYAARLINRWVEKTDPAKHVFEDLSIAAFLIELWRRMYGSNFLDFRGFVDIACGNGMLVYILIMEGFRGWGFDARARRTWSTLPDTVTAHLKEMVCIPRPFLEALQSREYALREDLPITDGIFEKDTFIISNHADELSTWTPLLATLSCLESPLPWLAIPCCSHALSGAAYRYPSSTPQSTSVNAGQDFRKSQHDMDSPHDDDEQPQTGDLTALRALRNENRACLESGKSNAASSKYASLVNQVIYLAKGVDPTDDVQQTLMRIPSTRNIGLIGGQQRIIRHRKAQKNELESHPVMPDQSQKKTAAELKRLVFNIVEQECMRSGGVAKAAVIWMEGVKRARGLRRSMSPC